MKLLKKTAAVVTATSLLAVGNIGVMPRDAVKNFMLSVSAADSDIVASGKFGIYGDNLTWELDSEGTLTISGEGDMDVWEYSSRVAWSSYDSDIVSVVIEDGVTSIGNYAFYDCESLTSITIPDSVTNIGCGAFFNCVGLTSITIPYSVTSIGASAFEYCTSLTSIIIPDSVTSIGYSVFYSCESLTSITIPDSVTSIGDLAFSYCYSLTSITIPDSVTSIGDRAFAYCGDLTSVIIPDSVTAIGDEAFYYCKSLTSIILPDGVTSIGDRAFYWCDSLTSITIPDSVTSIGDSAFSCCYSLTDINVNSKNKYYASEDGVLFNKDKSVLILYPKGKTVKEYSILDSVTTIGNDAFFNCLSLTSIIITDSVTTIGDNAFSYCYGLTSVTISDSVTTIGDYAFSDCESLTSITIPNSVTTIGKNVFSYCIGLTSITIPDSVTTIGYGAFSGCLSLTSITIPDSVTTIGYGAFSDCYDLTSITIPDSVTTIGSDAFSYCIGLTSITIPDSVVVIGDGAFSYCDNLTSVTIENPECDINDETYTIFNKYDYQLKEYKFDGTIYGHEGSTAQAYAKKYNRKFELIAPLSIVKQPQSVVVPNGKKASVTVNATGDGLTYTWYVCSPTGTKYTKSSITSATYSYAMTSEKSGRKVYCVITDMYGNSVKTDTVTLSIGNALEITAQPESVVVPNGEKASVTVNATGDGLTYKWYYKNKGASKFSYTSTFTGNKYSVTMSDSRDGRQIYCVITDKYGNSVKTDTVTLIQE